MHARLVDDLPGLSLSLAVTARVVEQEFISRQLKSLDQGKPTH